MNAILCRFKSLLYIVSFMTLFTSCLSPEEKIREDIELKTEAFRKKDSDYLVQDSKVCIYNTAKNINYLADESIRNLAISYANYLGWAEYYSQQARKYRNSTKLDKDYNPNWFEEAKRADKNAEEYQQFANDKYTELLQLKDSLDFNTVGGIWVYHEITYKKYIYSYYAGPYVNRTLYLYSKDGESILWSDEIRFYNEMLLTLFGITNTNYDASAESTFKSVRSCVIAILVILFIALLVRAYKKGAANLKAKEEKEKAERMQRAKVREEERLKEQKEWEDLLQERENLYGPLTKQISIDYKRKNDIYVYEDGQIIFIMGVKYKFSDIISCNIDKKIYKKGTTILTTTPDKFEMAEQQVLWGMGQKYNVKSTTHTKTTPDQYMYVVTIGIKSIASPQIEISLKNQSVANEISNLIKVINTY